MGFLTALLPMPYRILGLVALIVGLYLYAHHEGAVESHNEDIAAQAANTAKMIKAARNLHDADQAAFQKSEAAKQALRAQLFKTQQGAEDVLKKYTDLVNNPVCSLPPVLMCIFNGGDPDECSKAGPARQRHDPVPGPSTKEGPVTGRGNHVSGPNRVACVYRVPAQAALAKRLD